MQPVSFSAKQRFEQHKPYYRHNSKMTQPTLEATVARYKEQEAAQNAQAVVPMIKRASEFALNKANKVTKESKLIQDYADDLYEKIEATNAYNVYFNDKNARFGRTLNLYSDEVEFGDKLFDIVIYPDKKITAVERNNTITSRIQANVGKLKGTTFEYSGKDIYEFDIQTGELTYFAKDTKKKAMLHQLKKNFSLLMAN